MDQYIARMRNEHAFDDTASVTLVAGKFYVRMGQFQQRCEFASEFLSPVLPRPFLRILEQPRARRSTPNRPVRLVWTSSF